MSVTAVVLEDTAPEAPGGAERGLVPYDLIKTLVDARDATLEAYGRFFDRLDAAHAELGVAQKLLDEACGPRDQMFAMLGDGHLQEIKDFNSVTRLPDLALQRKVVRRLVDLQVWAAVVTYSDLQALMDKTAKDELRKAMAYVPIDGNGRYSDHGLMRNADAAKELPPISVDNVMATLEQFRDNAAETWARGISVAFSTLDRRFRTHNGFSVGSRVILSRIFSEDYGSWAYGSHGEDTLRDIERVFLVMDGKPPSSRYHGIVEQIKGERAEDGGRGPRQSVHKGQYFEVRVFMNGNAHLWFRRPDLVDKVNLTLAAYYQKGMGWGSAEQEQQPDELFERAMERAPAKNFGLFESPPYVVERVIDRASLWANETLTVLEPNAGTGNLVRGVLERREEHRVTAVEIQPEMAAALQASGLCAGGVQCRDFLKMTPEPIFDRIVMNPPFDKGRDIDHVWHATKFLKPGGRLVSVMAASSEYATTPKAVALRNLVSANKGAFEDLPAGSFKEAGTNVNTVILHFTLRSQHADNR